MKKATNIAAKAKVNRFASTALGNQFLKMAQKLLKVESIKSRRRLRKTRFASWEGC